MTVFQLAGSHEAAGLSAFLGRLLRYDRSAAVRLQTHGNVLAVFGHPPFDVLAVRTARLAPEPGRGTTRMPPLDATVSAGQLLDGLDDMAATALVPPTVTGPPWTGVLPPRGGWRRAGVVSAAEVRCEVSQGIAEFRSRTEELAQRQRTRGELDRIASDIWSRPLQAPGSAGLPLRAMHAAQALGFLRESTTVPAGTTDHTATRHREPSKGTGRLASAVAPHEERLADEIVVLASGKWLRARTVYGSIVTRHTGGPELTVTPLSVTPRS